MTFTTPHFYRSQRHGNVGEQLHQEETAVAIQRRVSSVAVSMLLFSLLLV